MTLEPGTTVGQYRILDLLGKGGMGEVYKARDLKLGRDVAIKILPEIFSGDPDRLARFRREARVLAALNHPHVGAIYGLEEAEGVRALVLELVDGKTLAKHLSQPRDHALPLEEALRIARQIAEALEVAHDKGIIHRDLKPANITITCDGTVKVLDFGLAKLEPDPASIDATDAADTRSDPTLGRVLGTTGYMSPEQARGLAVDRRTDIWSFGCVLYQMLAGRPPFAAGTNSDVLADILKTEPDWTRLAGMPPPILRLVRRCLRKEQHLRLRDIADARFEIEEVLAEPPGLAALPSVPVGRRRGSRVWLTSAVVGLLLATAVAVWLFARGRQEAPFAERLVIPLGADQQIVPGPSPMLAISPDGRLFVYAAHSGSRTQLFLRQLNRFEGTPIAATEAASAPFFSPDGEWVGFFAADALQKVSLGGGVPSKICETPSVLSASWGADDTIVFATSFSGDGLWRVSAGGSVPEQLTKPDVVKGEMQHVYPQVLPGGKVLFTVLTADSSYPAVLITKTRQWHALTQIRMTSGRVQYLSTGHLLYAQAGRLFAVPFDLSRGDVTSSPLPLSERVEMSAQAPAQFAVAPGGTGSLVYVPARTLAARILTLVDREGHASPLTDMRAAYAHPRFSPDGRLLAVTIDTEGSSDVWVYDLQRRTRTRLSWGGAAGFPVWTPEGRQVAFHAARSGPWNLFARQADGSAPIEPLISAPRPERPVSGGRSIEQLLPGNLPVLSGANPQYPASWTKDGSSLAFTERKPNGERDIWVLARGGELVPFLVTPFDEFSPAFSPDGRFLAYVSDESGRNDVYVQPYPGPGPRWLVSIEGGEDPIWSPDGREIIYRRGDALMTVSVQTNPSFSVGEEHRVFEGRYEASMTARNYDVSPDGRHFVFVRGEDTVGAPQFHVVLNWVSELGHRATLGLVD
jgi:Tol biopolymer transport system component